jgi:putative ABC transport system permease protein
MIRMAVRGLRHRRASFIATFFAVTFGAAIVMACGGLMETGIRSNVEAHRLAAAQIVVLGKQSHQLPGADESMTLAEGVRIPAALIDDVRGVDGVEAAIGEVTFPATVLRSDASAVVRGEGHGWSSARLAPYRLRAGRPPATDGEVVVDGTTAKLAHLRPGSKVSLVIRGEPTTYRVSGVADGPAGTTFFGDAEASRLAGHPGLVDDIGILVAKGKDTEQIRKQVDNAIGDRASTLAGADRGLAEHPDANEKESLVALAGSFGGIATMTMMFVVASTLTLVAQHRHRELALMRTIGATPRQVRRMMLVETMLVSVPAALAGCLPGLWLGGYLLDRLADHGVASPYVEYHQGLLPLGIGVGAALIAAIGAAVIAGHRAGKARPVEALADAGLQRQWFGWVRFVAGVLFLAGAGALVILTATVMSGPLASATAGPAVLCWAIGIALLGPGFTKIVVWLLRYPLQAVSGVSGRLAAVNVSARTTAMSAVVMPVMLATGIATAYLYMQTTQVAAAEKAFTDTLRADAVVTTTAGQVSPHLLDRVRRTEGVAGASAYVTSIGVIDEPRKGQSDDGTPLEGIGAQGPDGPAAVRLTDGSLTGLTGNTVGLPERMADKMHIAVGDRIKMTLGDGVQVELRVVATYDAKRGYETILMPADLLAAHTRAGLPERIMVRAADGTSMAALRKALSAIQFGVVVANRDEIVAEHAEDLQTQAWVNYLIVGMIIAYTAVSVINTLAASTVRRRREFGLQRLTGGTPSQVLRMMFGEGVLVTVAGVLLGTVVALLTLLPFSATVSDSGTPTGPIWIYLAVVGSATVLTLGATMVPAWLTLRSRPMAAVVAVD